MPAVFQQGSRLSGWILGRAARNQAAVVAAPAFCEAGAHGTGTSPLGVAPGGLGFVTKVV